MSRHSGDFLHSCVFILALPVYQQFGSPWVFRINYSKCHLFPLDFFEMRSTNRPRGVISFQLMKATAVCPGRSRLHPLMSFFSLQTKTPGAIEPTVAPTERPALTSATHDGSS